MSFKANPHSKWNRITPYILNGDFEHLTKMLLYIVLENPIIMHFYI